MARLAEAAETAVRAAGGVVSCRTTVRELIRTAVGFQLVVGPAVAPRTVSADAVIVAVPAPAAARLLRTVAPSAAAELSGVEYASMAVVTVAFRAADDTGDLHGSGFLVPPVDGRSIKAATYSTKKWGWLSHDLVVVRCSVGRHGDERQLQRDDRELVEDVLADLHAAVGLGAKPLDALVTRWGGALPQYAVGHRDRVRRIRASAGQVPGLAVCGAAYDGLGLPACIASAQQAATQVTSHLRTRETMPT